MASINFCDYRFQYETSQDSLDRCVAILFLQIQDRDFEYFEQFVKAKEDFIQDSKQKNSKELYLVKFGFISLLVVLLSALSFALFFSK